MKFTIEKHHYLDGWSVTGNSEFYLSELSYENIYYILYKKEMVDSPEIIKEKFNAFYTRPFVFKNKEDVEKFVEYLEPIIVMEELTK